MGQPVPGPFACRACGCAYATEVEARRCAAQAVPTPKFEVGAQVIYRTVAIEFPTRVLSRTLAFTRIAPQGLGTHTWFYDVDYPEMKTVTTPEPLLHPARSDTTRKRSEPTKRRTPRARRRT